VTEIGRITQGEGVDFIGADGKTLAFQHAAFSHF
jgi:hypothetical protein